MLLEDRPILNSEEDMLDRLSYAHKLGYIIADIETESGYCIGLHGPWGSGKTSLINLIVDEVKKLSCERDIEPVIMFFNPWNFTSVDQLVQNFFTMLAHRFSSKRDRLLHEIGEDLKIYADMFGDKGNIVRAGEKLFNRKIGKKSVYNNDISMQKEKLVELLRGKEKKIIIIIDDIDRLTNDQIRMVFQLVSSVANFPNVIYLLSYDKEIIARALSAIQDIDGDRYLEKIIQLPIEVPMVSNENLWNIFYCDLEAVAKINRNMKFEQSYWNNVFDVCVTKYVRNARDVKRLMNGLIIKVRMIGDDINLVDLIAITLIEQKEYKLYAWIKENPSKLIGGIEESLRSYGKSIEEMRKIFLSDLKAIDADKADDYFSLLNVIFPYYASKTNSIREYHEDDYYRRMQRIGHKDYFDRYFRFEIDKYSIPRKTVDNAIFYKTENELEVLMLSLIKSKRMMFFLNELSAAIDEVNEDRIPVLVAAILKRSSDFSGEEDRRLFQVSEFQLAEYRVRALLLKIEDEGERYILLKEQIDLDDGRALPMLADMLNSIELAYGKLAAEGQERGEKMISDVHLIECETAFKNKVIELSKHTCLMDLCNCEMILYLFKAYGKSEYMEYMHEELSSDINKLKFVCMFVDRWVGNITVNWQIKDEYKDMLDDSLILEAIYNCIENQSIWNLTEGKQHRIIAFLLWQENGAEKNSEIDDKDVETRIKMIRREILSV